LDCDCRLRIENEASAPPQKRFAGSFAVGFRMERGYLRNHENVEIIACFIQTAAERPVNIGFGIIKIAKISLGRFDASGLALIDSALPDKRAHVAVAIQIKNLKIDIAMGGLKEAGPFACINIRCSRTGGYHPCQKDNGY